MKIIYLLSQNKRDAITLSVSDMAQALGAVGHKIHVVTADKSLASDLKAENVASTYASMGGTFDFVSPMKISKLIDDGQPAIMHVNSLHECYIADRARNLSGNKAVKIVLCHNHVDEPKNIALALRHMSAVDGSIFTSEPVKDIVCRALRIDTATHKSALLNPSAPKRNAQYAEPLIMWHGNITEPTAIRCIVQTMAKADSGIKACIMGTGRGQTVIPVLNEARKLGVYDRMDWKGDVTDIRRLTNTAFAALLPLHEHAAVQEAAEYIGAGIPIILSRRHPASLMVESLGAGIVTDNESPAAFADAINALAADNASLRDKISREMNRPDFDAFLSSIISFYNSLLS